MQLITTCMTLNFPKCTAESLASTFQITSLFSANLRNCEVKLREYIHKTPTELCITYPEMYFCPQQANHCEDL